MPQRHVVVDGSNIATEGRTIPSLRQLNEAVLAFQYEYPDADITVVVDASFSHRIDPSELAEFEAAEAANELVSPPAGAIGRGDAFLLRIAGKIGAQVLSNDSFQEFHGEHEWLFDDGRLIGGKPVPGIGWIFTPRTPVRGVKSRKAVKEAKGSKRGATASGEALGPMPVPTKPPPRAKAKPKPKGREVSASKNVEEAIAVAAEEAVTTEEDEPKRGRKRRRRKRVERPAEPVNDALTFITFITEHPLGAQVDGEVDSFTSHGAFVIAAGARCYIPIVALGDPPPRAARDVLTRGDVRAYVVQAFDPQRRGIELGLPGFAHVAGHPTEETIAAEIEADASAGVTKPAPKRSGAKKAAVAKASVATTTATRAKKTVTKAATKQTPAEAANAAAKKAPAKATAKGSPAKPATKAAAKKTPAKPATKAAKMTPAKSATRGAAKATPAQAGAAEAAAKAGAEKTAGKAGAEKSAAKAGAAKTARKAGAEGTPAKVGAKKGPPKGSAAKVGATDSAGEKPAAGKTGGRRPADGKPADAKTAANKTAARKTAANKTAAKKTAAQGPPR